MRPPDNKNPGCGGQGSRETVLQGNANNTATVTAAQAGRARPFVVVITAGTRRGRWGHFETIEAAASIASKLRRHGMAATVERTDGGEL